MYKETETRKRDSSSCFSAHRFFLTVRV